MLISEYFLLLITNWSTILPHVLNYIKLSFNKQILKPLLIFRLRDCCELEITRPFTDSVMVCVFLLSVSSLPILFIALWSTQKKFYRDFKQAARQAIFGRMFGCAVCIHIIQSNQERDFGIPADVPSMMTTCILFWFSSRFFKYSSTELFIFQSWFKSFWSWIISILILKNPRPAASKFPTRWDQRYPATDAVIIFCLLHDECFPIPEGCFVIVLCAGAMICDAYALRQLCALCKDRLTYR